MIGRRKAKRAASEGSASDQGHAFTPAERFTRLFERVAQKMPPGWAESYRLMRMTSEGQRAWERWSESWLRAGGLVLRSRYLDALEENERLRRKVADLEARLGISQDDTTSPSIEGVFEEMLDAQKRWLDTWMPRPSSSSKDE